MDASELWKRDGEPGGTMRLCRACCLAALLGLLPGALAAAPIPLSLTVIPIGVGPGGQTDPHVSGNLVSYTDTPAGTIRYYDFATGTNLAIPQEPGSIDVLSDVSDGRIAFTRLVIGNRNAIMLFDTATPAVPPVEVNPLAGSNRVGVALGGSSLVYGEYGTYAARIPSDIVHFDILTNAVTPITADTIEDYDPRVAPGGDVIMWAHCPGLGFCEVHQAVRSGMGWTTSLVSSFVSGQREFDTNGTIVAYSDQRPGTLDGPDLFWRPVAGGPEQQLVLDGYQNLLSISGNIVSFQSMTVGASNSDIMLYDLGTGRLYQVTATPDVHESLNDLYVFPDGRVSLVWEADDDIDGNIYGAQFYLPAAGAPAPATLLLVALGCCALAWSRRSCSSRV